MWMHGWQNDVSLVKIRISRKATDMQKLQESKAKLLKARQKEGVRVNVYMCMRTCKMY